MTVKRVGIIGYGHLGRFLKEQLEKDERFKVTKIWNRTDHSDPTILPLSLLDAENISCVHMVIEVAHPSVVSNFGALILKYADLFVGSATALADGALYETLKQVVKVNNRRMFVPGGSLWGAHDIQKMANLGTLKGLTVTMIKHPTSLRLEGPLKELNEKARLSDSAVVLYDGPVRALCSLAPNNVNTMAGAAIAAHNLGFDLTRAKLISDPSLFQWHIVEIDVEGPDGFRTRTRQENPTKPGALNDISTYYSLFASIQETFFKPPGVHIV